jgi:hypothetical protein
VKRGILVIALVSAPLFGDEVYLKGGGQISGEIVERTAEAVTVDIGGGTMTVRMSTVVRIDEESTAPLQEYRARAATLSPDDARGWSELAQWAEDRALATQAREAWSQVVAISPDDPEANAALGRVQLDGRWVSEEESYRARGYVEFEGEWMMPGEKQAILSERQAQAESDREMLQAQVQAEQQAAADREAEEQAEHDEFWGNDLPQLGDPVPVYWGWGGPAYWPAVPAQPARPATLPARGRR